MAERAKYSITEAAAKRIGKKLWEGKKFWYQDAVDALKEENFYKPERAVGELITALDDAGFHHIAITIGRSAAGEARQARAAIRELRGALLTFLDPEQVSAGDPE